MTEGRPSNPPFPRLDWDGSVQIQTQTALEIGSELQITLVWSEPVQPLECLISLRDPRAAVIWSERIAAGESGLVYRISPTASIGTYSLDVSHDNWTLAEENIEVLAKNELVHYEAFAEAVSLREQAARAATWEEAAGFDELAADAYERSGTDHLAAISLLDVAQSALANAAPDRAQAAAVRATNLAVKIDNMPLLASALFRLGQAEVQLDRREIAMATLDRARTVAELASDDLLAVKSSMLQWRCSIGQDRMSRLQHYRNLLPMLTYAVTPGAQKEALTCIRELKPYLTLELAAPIGMGPRQWAATCDFGSRHLSQFAGLSKVAEVVVPWDSSAELFSNALLKRILTSLSKWLVKSSLDVVLAVEANRGESGESFKVTLRDPKVTLEVGDATQAWSQSEEFNFLHELSTSAGGKIHAHPKAGETLVEFNLPSKV